MKTIYCSIPPRKKAIKFESKNGIPDKDIIQKKILELCKTDIILNKMLKNKVIIFQHTDSNNQVCDVEDEDVIEDKSEISVILLDDIEHKLPNTDEENPIIVPLATSKYDFIPLMHEDNYDASKDSESFEFDIITKTENFAEISFEDQSKEYSEILQKEDAGQKQQVWKKQVISVEENEKLQGQKNEV